MPKDFHRATFGKEADPKILPPIFHIEAQHIFEKVDCLGCSFSARSEPTESLDSYGSDFALGAFQLPLPHTTSKARCGLKTLCPGPVEA